MRLYHYRSIQSALLEIGNSTFHFSGVEELNDPLEGYLQVYWKGDRAAWEGLFRNYICSLRHAIDLYLLREPPPDTLRQRVLLVDIHQFDDTPFGKQLSMLGDCFLETQICQRICKLYDDQNISCGATELQFLLRMIHETAYELCMDACINEGLIPPEQVVNLKKPWSNPAHTMLDSFEKFALEKDQQARERLVSVAEQTIMDAIETAYLSYHVLEEPIFYEEQRRAWLSIVIEFPSLYLAKLKELIYPPGYVVCFSTSNDNSSMWGNYACNHQGVCLIYETEDQDGKSFLHAGHLKREVKPVQYGGDLQTRNFFETFGRLTFPQIKTWLTGRKSVSKYFQAFQDEDTWRQRYWADYDTKFFRKLDAWKHEREQRMLLSDMLFSYTKPSSRNLSYRPEAFKGIIFGIRTSEHDKLSLIKCLLRARHSLDDLEFYQACYDDATQSILIRSQNLPIWWKNHSPKQSVSKEDKIMKKTVIFLGAGASKADGAPLQSELFKSYICSLNDRGNKNHVTANSFANNQHHMRSCLYDFLLEFFGLDLRANEQIMHIDDSAFPTFEEALGVLDLAISRNESYKSHHHHTLQDMRTALIYSMASAIQYQLDYVTHETRGYHRQLISWLKSRMLHNEITLLTTNYDLLADNAIEYAGATCDYGFDVSSFYARNKMRLLKIHGSFNWLYCPVCKRLQTTPGQKSMIHVTRNPHDLRCPNCQEKQLLPIIVPPTFYKDMSNPYLLQVYEAAEQALLDTEQIIFCGYSFPDADMHIKYLLKRAEQNGHREGPLGIKVINHGNNDAEKKRYQRFFKDKDHIHYYEHASFEDFVSDPLCFLYDP